jgi:hypothetical protein
MFASNGEEASSFLLVTTGWAEYRPPYFFPFEHQVAPFDVPPTSLNGTRFGGNRTPSTDRDVDFPSPSAVTMTVGGGIENRSLPEIVAVCLVVVVLSLITSGGNLLVIVSFKMDSQLQTVSNYFLLSLSVADLTIGLISMPLYSVYLLMNYWPLGRIICDAWLSLDYTISNASVANLLLISFDRYFSVTRPLTYRAKRTSSRAVAMIAGAWTVSALLWTPWIVAWPYIEGRRTVPPRQCYIQFLETNKYFTIVTAIAAFYLPVLIMSVLFFRIYRETEKRQKGLAELQGCGGSMPLLGMKLPASSTATRSSTGNGQRLGSTAPSTVDDGGAVADSDGVSSTKRFSWRLPWMPGSWRHRPATSSDSNAAASNAFVAAASAKLCSTPHPGTSSVSGSGILLLQRAVTHGYSCRRLLSDADSAANQLQASPVLLRHRQATQTPAAYSDATTAAAAGGAQAQSVNSADCASDAIKHLFRLPPKSADGDGTATKSDACYQASSAHRSETHYSGRETHVRETAVAETARSTSGLQSPNQHSETVRSNITNEVTPASGDKTTEGPEIRVSATDGVENEVTERDIDEAVELSIPPALRGSLAGRRSAMTLHRVAMQACVAARLTQVVRDRRERKQRQQQEKKAERKAARTLTAVLLAFVVTWTPYNVFILVQAFCPDCIHPTLYAVGKLLNSYNGR